MHDATVTRQALVGLCDRLVGELNGADHWSGHLSSSALSTAVAAFALSSLDREQHAAHIGGALEWLVRNVNADGGWGDTPRSPSNLSTTLLAWSALSLAQAWALPSRSAIFAAETWLRNRVGNLEPKSIADALAARYGADRSFSAPILLMCAMAGRLGEGDRAWRLVPQLPFELAAVPRALLRFLRLQVVSYAIPALIAVGLARHRRWESSGAAKRIVRDHCASRALEVLERAQPPSGGFLEAAPLTGFVAMGLAAAGSAGHPVAASCARFLVGTVRDDGSWPIDTDLSVWVTTLAVNALAEAQPEALPGPVRGPLRRWLLARQHLRRHPYTGADPGGWAWTDRSGGVPDADDTAGALLALRRLGPVDGESLATARNGIRWLLGLQNTDGGWPTFCRGWGRLPFDQSCPEITVHVVQALDAWYDDMTPAGQLRIDTRMQSGVDYLSRVRRRDGSWVPLWFGSPFTQDESNPVYGTARVVGALRDITPGRMPVRDELVERGCSWLAGAQNRDGGWGGGRGAPSSVEETSLAVAALAGGGHGEECDRGVEWLLSHVRGEDLPAAPIGLYFARLWYSERLYPIIFSIAALGRVLDRSEEPTSAR